MGDERPIASLLFHTRCAEPEQSADIQQAMAQIVRWAEGKFTDCITAEHHLYVTAFWDGGACQCAYP